MRFDAVTIFPGMFDAVTRFGITGRAHERGLWELACWNPRDFATDAYRSVDDRPYGGGPGMVMLAQPLADAIAAARRAGAGGRPVIALSPQGRPLDDRRVRELAAGAGAILVAGRYEAIDQRLLDRHVDEEIAVGDFVVSGGELPAMMLIDAVVRQLPGAMNDARSAACDSFAEGLLDCPHYTRPEVFEGVPVPEVLLSGHHARIARWRREQSLRATLRLRPELIARAREQGRLDVADERFLDSLGDSLPDAPLQEPGRPRLPDEPEKA
ncbi:MAG: tRNA (guanosine(37)-N1)-methyltransferase TrmD [Burkholderiaceae bacterium]|nr:tRNA (guanosine(37)-N1)-methyltransferase TrmD [Burkholderiaceae bacterium]